MWLHTGNISNVHRVPIASIASIASQRAGSVRAYFMCHFVVNCASLWCFKNKSSEFNAFDMVLIATGVCWLLGSSSLFSFYCSCNAVVLLRGTMHFTVLNLVAIVNYLLCTRQVQVVCTPNSTHTHTHTHTCPSRDTEVCFFTQFSTCLL